jgi:hypothetical protein
MMRQVAQALSPASKWSEPRFLPGFPSMGSGREKVYK